MAIRIPTGPVPKNTARNVSFALGVAGVVVSFFFPQYDELLRQVGGFLAALGLTLGGSNTTEPQVWK